MLKLQLLFLRLYEQMGEGLARGFGRRFYLVLAALLSVFAVVDAARLHWIFDLRQASYDTLIRHRLHVRAADPNIVILNIDEASLARLSGELGRWPWPRQVLADVVSRIEQQQPRAIVFDVLFSEPDIYNPDSDAAFADFVRQCQRCFLPWVRLDPAQDKLSRLDSRQVPGALPRHGTPAAVAGILPLFDVDGRIGFNTALPDPDGIVRQYAVYEDRGAARLPALPARVLQGRGVPADLSGLPPTILLNWRGPPFSYPYVSFADLYLDSLKEHRQRRPDEFRDRIVIIGSTAASLFDVKATPIAEQFPGVEVVATAIDNLQHGDYMRVPPLRWLYLMLALVLVWATALSFYRHMAPEKLARWFGLSQVGLLLVSWASINWSPWYINLLGPVSYAIACYTLARLYAFATRRALEDNIVLADRRRDSPAQLWLAWAQITTADGRPAPEPLLEHLRRALPAPAAAQGLVAPQKGVWRALEGSVMLCAITPPGAPAPWHEHELSAQMTAWLHAHQQPYGLRQCRVSSCLSARGSAHDNDWLALLAGTLGTAAQSDKET